MTRSVRYGAVTLLVSSLVLLGCSSGDDDSSSTTTAAPNTTTTTGAASFGSQLSNLCDSADQDATAAQQDFETAIAIVQDADPQSAEYRSALDDAETAVESVLHTFDDFEQHVQQLDVPAEAQNTLDDYLHALDTEKGIFQDLRDSIASD